MANEAREPDRIQRIAAKMNKPLPLGEAVVSAPITESVKVGESIGLDVTGNTVVSKIPLTQIGEKVVGSTIRRNKYRLARGGGVMEE